MGANKFVKIAALVLALLVLLVTVKTCSNREAMKQDVVVEGGSALSQEGLAGLGIEADTEKDVVATLIGEVRGLKSDIEILRDDNRSLRTDNDDLKKMEGNIASRLTGKISQAESSVRKETQDKYNTMLRRLQEAEESLRASQSGSASLGRDQGGGADGVTGSWDGGDDSETVWVQPLGRSGDEDSSGAGMFGQTRDQLSKKIGVDNLPGVRGRNYLEEETMKPVYTIAKNATLVNSTALTALVGRVPVGSQVTDPYSFKVIIGRDNLIANGIELPEVAYSVASGKAVGDWTLGCVRGDLYSITFVFEDGTIRTVPKAESVYDGNTQNTEIKIGELSDAYGNPCVVGERITNAYTYLAQRIGITAASAAAEAAAASQTTVLTSLDGGGIGTSSTVDGSTSDYILGKTIADGTMEVAEWLDERQSQQFDAIYVAPGAKVSLHVTEQIEIDYDTLGRKTNFIGIRRGGYRGLD
jgi:integrating conjugative element protein (TIGR03752 family)